MAAWGYEFIFECWAAMLYPLFIIIIIIFLYFLYYDVM